MSSARESIMTGEYGFLITKEMRGSFVSRCAIDTFAIIKKSDWDRILKFACSP